MSAPMTNKTVKAGLDAKALEALKWHQRQLDMDGVEVGVRSMTSEQLVEQLRAPVQGFSAGIPWSLHLRAWDAYATKYGRSQTAKRLAERGGFGTCELDVFVPGWRDEVSEITRLQEALAAAEARIAEARKNALEEAAQVAAGKSGEFDFATALAECRDSEHGFHSGRLHATQAIRSLACATCNGHGQVGGLIRWGDGEVDSICEPCPDCAPNPPVDAK